MSVKRPTFSESWYRVAELNPTLRNSVQVFRQYYRGAMWYVIRDPSNNQFFRVNDAAYHFIGLLDGRRKVKEVWDLCNAQLGDRAPTQNEVIQLLGQLYTSNLLWADIPLDNVGLFERYRKRVTREVRGYLMNLLFVRIPLVDPDWLLEKWVNVVGWMFGPIGFMFWLVLMGLGISAALGNYEQLTKEFVDDKFFDTENLVLLYTVFTLIKIIHEFGHGFTCKRYGKLNGSGGEVHTMGVMFLVFAPVPYVDASSSWAFRSKWQRFFVGSGGMYVELPLAAGAAIIWANTLPDTLTHAICYNVLFVASVSTILFNANPLLRYDGYYMLSDALEIPNLNQRGRQYVYYVVKKYLFGVQHLNCPAHSGGEKFWLFLYTVTSFIYRIFVCVAILYYIADQLFFLGFLLACGAVFTWVFVPIGKFVQYLATNGELSRCRTRATLVTLSIITTTVVMLGLVPFTEHQRAEGYIEPRRFAYVYMNTDGYLNPDALPSSASVNPDSGFLLTAENPMLQAEFLKKAAELELTTIRYHRALSEEPSMAPLLAQEMALKEHEIRDVRRQLDDLRLKAPFEGQWVTEVEQAKGAYMKRGQKEPLGMVASTQRVRDLYVRVVTEQELGPRVLRELQDGGAVPVEMRVKGRPGIFFTGRISKVIPAGQEQLPSRALGYYAGGSMSVDVKEESGTKTTKPFFEVVIEIDESSLTLDSISGDKPALRAGQLVVARFDLPARPLMSQWSLALRQMLQGRFGI